MNRNQRIVISIVGILIVGLALVGLTYGYFLTRIIGNSSEKSITGTLNNLELTYGDGNGTIAPTEKINPGKKLASKTFTVTNTGSSRVENYVVNFENVTNTLTRINDLVYELTCVSSDDEPCDGVEKGTFPVIPEIIAINSINPKTVHTYTLTVEYIEANEDQSVDMGAEFSAKVNINNAINANPYKDKPNTLAYKILNNTLVNLTNNNKNDTIFDKNSSFRLKDEFSGVSYVAVMSFGERTYEEYTSLLSEFAQYVIYGKSITCSDDLTKCWIEDARLGNTEETLNDNFNELYIIVPDESNPFDMNTDVESNKYLNIGPFDIEVPYRYFKVSKLKDGQLELEWFIIAKGAAPNPVLTKTYDDNGASYYYRANVIDNYLNYNNMCWRIVRIEGDGSIKLVLEDKDYTCEMGGHNFSIGYGNYGYSDKGSYVMADYKNSDNRTNSAKYIIDDWVDNNLDKSKLKKETWCSKTGFRRFETDEATLKCDQDSEKIYEYGGLLTADEVFFSSHVTSEYGEYSGYLSDIPNFFEGYSPWWTLSVYGTAAEAWEGYDESSVIWGVADTLKYSSQACWDCEIKLIYASSSHDIRPSVVLKADIEYSGGNGTKSNPYTIK